MELSYQEKLTLIKLGETKRVKFEELVEKTGLDQVAVMRSVLGLQAKGLAKLHERSERVAVLTETGRKYAQIGLPEWRALKLLREKGKVTLDDLKEVLSNEYHRNVVIFTISQALASTVLTVLIGLPGAYIFANYDFPGKRVIRAVLTVPFVMPGIMVALGFVLLFGKEGFIAELVGHDLGIVYSWKAILLAHSFYNFPIVVRMVSALWQRVNPHYEEMAEVLGAKGFTLFRKVTLPLISPAIFASAMLTFVFCFLSFSVPLILGGYQYVTIEVDIFSTIVTLLDFRTGAALAVIQLSLSVVFIYLYLKALEAYSKREEQRIMSCLLYTSPSPRDS
jgi:thiamine transport system permease protein